MVSSKKLIGNTRESNKRSRMKLDKLSAESRLDTQVEIPNEQMPDHIAQRGCYSGHRYARQSNLTGLKFGSLTVGDLISQSKLNTGHYIYECVCDCGFPTRARSDALIRGKKTACGGNHCKQRSFHQARRIGKSWFCGCGNRVDISSNDGLCARCARVKKAKLLPEINIDSLDGKIIKLRKNGWTLQEIGDFFSVTNEAIRQRLSKFDIEKPEADDVPVLPNNLQD